MALILKETESPPAEYPALPDDLTDTADQAPGLWQRIEAYCRTRYTPRNVEWIVSGTGDWNPPLEPTTLTTLEIWQDNAWDRVEPYATPLGGYFLPAEGHYRIQGDIAGAEVPAAVWEAYRRLAGYLGDFLSHYSAPRFKLALGDIDFSFTQSETRKARALVLSGAADLLRPYKRRK